MARVDRTGTFLATPIDYGIDKTKNGGFPTFNIQAKLVKYYDEESGEWMAWDEYGQEIPIYLSLFGKNKKTQEIEPTLNHQQVMKVFEWSGDSFVDLINRDYKGLLFQVRIKDNDPKYATNNPFVPSYIDVADAAPIRGIKKLDTDSVRALDAEFAIATKKSAKPKTAVTAPKIPPKIPAKVVVPEKARGAEAQNPEPVAEASAVETLEEKKAKMLEKSKKNLAASKGKSAAVPPTRKVPSAPKTDSPEGECTKQEAWETIVELKAKDVTDEQLGEIWNSTIDEVVGEGIDNKDVTVKQWFSIREKVLDKVAIF